MAFGYYNFAPPYPCLNCPMMSQYLAKIPRTEEEQQDDSKEVEAMAEYDPNQQRIFPLLALPLLFAPFFFGAGGYGGGAPAYYGPPPYYYNYYYYYNR